MFIGGNGNETIGFLLGAALTGAGIWVQTRRDRADDEAYFAALRRGERPKPAYELPAWVPKALLAVALVNVVVSLLLWATPEVVRRMTSVRTIRGASLWYGALVVACFWVINQARMAPLVTAPSAIAIWSVRGIVLGGLLAAATRAAMLTSVSRSDVAGLIYLGIVLFVMWSIAAAVVLLGASAFFTERVKNVLENPFARRGRPDVRINGSSK